jgi:peptidoglycan/LPS O-acetylase OafA/YrhL
MPEVAHHRAAEASDVVRQDHGRSLRLDIEGMRAIAVGSVLAFHAGIPWLSGGFVGVDVFFVLSGFLITGLLAREVARTGRVRLATFWARRVRRLLPASATVLLFSALVAYVYLPFTQRPTFGGDIRAAALYVVNWRLADRAVDYLAEDVGASPVQHYWSLSVEEQFYLLWPVLMLMVGVFAARKWRAGSLVLLTAVTVASFAYSVAQSHSSPGTAFFVSTTRIWELGIGALLALSATQVGRLPVFVRAAGGWVGLAAIAYAALVFDGSTTWPGVNALVPTVGAALVIASGIAVTAGSPQRLLSLPPMVWIGGLSYSIYLWHWPMLVAAKADHPHLRLRYAVLLMILSVVPAWLCHKYIEDPIRFGSAVKSTPSALAMGAVLTALGVAAAFILSSSVNWNAAKEAPKSQTPGAQALVDKANAGKVWSDIKSVAKMRPLPVQAPKDRPPLYDDQPGCQVPVNNPKPDVCTFGDKTAKRSVLIVGDSKVVQWETALSDLGEREHFKLLQITKSACTFADVNNGGTDQRACRAWGNATLTKILQIKPDLVIESGRHSSALPDGKSGKSQLTQAAMVGGRASFWRTITAAGIPFVTLLDNPEPPVQSVYECVAEHPTSLNSCSFDKAEAISRSGAPSQLKAAAEVPGVKVLDMTNVVCPDQDRCAPVIGNVLVYRQGTHITRTYIDSAETQLAARLYAATGGHFGSR